MDPIEANRNNPNRHPWEIARAASVLSVLRALPTTTRYADIGAGDMYVTRQRAGRTMYPIMAVDTAFEAPMITGVINAHTSISHVPSAATDCAFLMDILEHVDDDDALLTEVLRVVRAGGLVVITVPAHRSLWSDHDVFLRHRRRYGRRELLRLVESCGLIAQERFYFFFFAMVLAGRPQRTTTRRRRVVILPLASVHPDGLAPPQNRLRHKPGTWSCLPSYCRTINLHDLANPGWFARSCSWRSRSSAILRAR